MNSPFANRIALLSMGSLLLIQSRATPAFSQQVDLCPKWKQGDRQYFELRQEIKLDDHEITKGGIEYTFSLIQEVVSAGATGATLELTIDRIRLEVEKYDVEFHNPFGHAAIKLWGKKTHSSFDTETLAPTEESPNIQKALQGLIGTKLVVELDGKNKLQKIQGADKVRRVFDSNICLPDLLVGLCQESVVKDLPPPQAWVELTTSSVLAPYQVEIGREWTSTRKYEVIQFGDLEIRNKCKAEQMHTTDGNDVLEISFRSEIAEQWSKDHDQSITGRYSGMIESDTRGRGIIQLTRRGKFEVLVPYVANEPPTKYTTKSSVTFKRLSIEEREREKVAARQTREKLDAAKAAREAAVVQETVQLLKQNYDKSLSLDLSNGIKMELVLIQPGEFLMGNPNSGDANSIHRVNLTRPFYMAKTEVTQQQYQAVMESNPSKFVGADLPVDTVSWNDCQVFCKRLSNKTGWIVRLPTEAEWEYSCRAGSSTKYCFGDDAKTLDDYGWTSSNSIEKTHPVGQKKYNVWGLHDMHGNVLEWCSDRFGPYSSEDQTDPTGPTSGNDRVVRGGCWHFPPGASRNDYRSGFRPDIERYYFGFRVVATR